MTFGYFWGSFEKSFEEQQGHTYIYIYTYLYIYIHVLHIYIYISNTWNIKGELGLKPAVEETILGKVGDQSVTFEFGIGDTTENPSRISFTYL